MRTMIGRLAISTLLMLVALANAQAQLLTHRPSDNLLARSDLQAIVDLQVERDARALLTHLGSTDPAVRARAALALASVQDSTTGPGLLALLDDEVPAVQADAAFALGQIQGHLPSYALLNALAQASEKTVEHSLVDALGKKGDSASLVPLVSWAWDDTTHHAQVALALGRYALRNIHAPEAVDYLIKNLSAENPTRRLYAAYYFGRSQDTTAWAPLADSVRLVLDSLSLDDPAAMYLVQGLGRLGKADDTPRLRHWMKEAEDWRTRVNAVRALSERTDEEGIRAAIFDRLVDPSVHVAVTAAHALNDGKAWSDKDIDLIKKWAQYNSYAWRITAPLLEGLAQQGETTFILNELELRRNSRNPLAYARSLSALAYLPYNVAFDLLVNATHSQNIRVAYAALNTLATRWEEERDNTRRRSAYFDVFVYGLQRKDQALSWISSHALSDSVFRALGAMTTMQQLYEELRPEEDLEIMTTILDALGASGDPAAEALLQREMTHAHPVVNAAAGKALGVFTGTTPVLPSSTRPPERAINWTYLQELGPHPQWVLETAKGTLTLVLDTEQAPLTVQTLATFTRDGKFNDVPFHRVVPNFVVQGGDFARQDGFGGPVFSIRSEFTRVPYQRGTIGMASSGKDTEGSQFFITHSMQPHLDGRYTAFGYVLDGLDAVDTLYEDDRIVSATIVPDPQQ